MKLQQWVEQHWYARSPGALGLLAPLEALYCHTMQQRQQAYRQGKKPSSHPGVPVIIVGNLTVGGSGKSPVVAALAACFQRQGYQPGIISRGYGGKASHYPLLVTASSDPAEVGDEPLMLAQQTGLPVAVDPNRPEAARLLVEQGCNLLLADDGLQHLALERDIELVVLDGARGLGNGHCLPVGPLREASSRLNTVDFILCQGELKVPLPADCPAADERWINYHLQQTGWRCGDGQTQTAMPFKSGQQVHALAGIGNPQRFFDQLRQQGLDVIEHPLKDHAAMDASLLNLPGEQPILMTAKDAVKLKPWLNTRHWVVEVQADLPQTLLDALQYKLNTLQQKPRP